MLVLALTLFIAFDDPTYQRDVAPILAKHCTVCHSDRTLDDPETSGGLSLESFERVTAGKEKKLVQTGNASASELFRRLTTADLKKRMPKDEAPLSQTEIEVVRRWIDAGAPKGEAAEPAYRRRETGRMGRLRELVVKWDVMAPAKSLGQPGGGPLSLAAPLQPLATFTALALSPDGTLLAGGAHRRVVVWDLKKANVVHQFTDPAGMISGLGFSRDGKTLFVAGGEAGRRGELRGYQIAEGKLLFEAGLSNEVLTGLAVHPDGRRVVLSGMDRKIRLFDAQERRERWSFRGHSDCAWNVAFSRDGSRIVSCGKDKSVKVWNTETGAVEQTLTGHREEVLAAVFSPDGGTVISGGKEPQVRVTKLGPGGKAGPVAGHSIALQGLTWNQSWTKLASAGADRSLKIWKPNGTVERTLQGAPDVIHACALSADGKATFGAGGDGVVYVWSVDAGRVVARLFVGDPGSGTSGPWCACAANGATVISEGLAPHAHWIVGTQEIPFERAPQPLRDPEAVVLALKGAAALKPALAPAPEPPKKSPPRKQGQGTKKIAAAGG